MTLFAIDAHIVLDFGDDTPPDSYTIRGGVKVELEGTTIPFGTAAAVIDELETDRIYEVEHD